jgi:hypothetical protein
LTDGKHFLQQRQRFTNRVAIGERAEIFAFRVFRAPMHRQARMNIAAEKNVGVRFVVAQQNVVARLIKLDVIVLKQQRFGFGMGYGDIDVMDVTHQRFGFSAANVRAKIARKPLFQIFGFADIDNRSGSVIHPVNAGFTGDRTQKDFGIKEVTHYLLTAPHYTGHV